ncbi:MAG: DUF3137 domain-containing protein [Firmicutes bacterium]|nr:DUF3137 domain-containing protein [Bacillota bacterium]
MDTQTNRTSSEISSSLKSNRSRSRAAMAFSTACIIVMIAFLFLGKYLFGILMLIPVIAGVLLMMRSEIKIKNTISGDIVNGIVNEVLDNAIYAAPYRLSDEIIVSSHMVLPQPYDKISGSDFINGEYKGLLLKMSDIDTRRVSTGDDEETDERVFDGQWLMCDFGKALSGEVHVSQITKSMPDSVKRQRIRMENEQFNEKFVVTADDPEEAFYVLTPHMMEYILSLEKKNKGIIYMSFLRDGKFHIAVNSGEDFFELGKKAPDYETLRQIFLDQLRWYTDIIDVLRLEPNLYK